MIEIRDQNRTKNETKTVGVGVKFAHEITFANVNHNNSSALVLYKFVTVEMTCN